MGDPRGSSPHTRGAQRRERRNDIAQRIIPAYAGSTRLWLARHTRSPDHPRIRGEHAGINARVQDTRRIIPAYAGSTQTCHTPCSRPADHPRIRGEHVMPSRNVNGVTGSSPHTRGAHDRRRVALGREGIIPAYAGSTCPLGLPFSLSPDHPRIRGEHTWKSLQYQGSPP